MKETCSCGGSISRVQKVIITSTSPPLSTMVFGSPNPGLPGSGTLEIASCSTCGLMYDPEVVFKSK